MLSASRPPVWRWNVAACWAASVGEIDPGRNATRKRRRSTTWLSAAQVIHASWQVVPVGVSAASKPASSAARATWAR